jgi:hypothetical protein
MRVFRGLLFMALVALSSHSTGFESDVHFGLTQWLALQAGFDAQAATIIATGDQRVDSGDVQYVDLGLMYACLGKDDVGSRRAGAFHYPSSGHVPGPPELRVVTPGGDAAWKFALVATKVPAEQTRYRLYELGEALHILQDSWAHQGIPDIPQPLEPFIICDATRAWGHPKARGGWNSHKADLTMHWPTDTVSMAKATYDVLAQYPELEGSKRAPRSWDEIRPALSRFVAASTKAEKKNWFAAQGLGDVSFLEGISLPDGPKPLDLKWPGRKLTPLNTLQSRQRDVPAEVLKFYTRFLERWLSATDFEALAAEFGVDTSKASKRGVSSIRLNRAELAGRLRAWRVRDHGRVAEIAHAMQPLTPSQRVTLAEIGNGADAYARYDSPAGGVFPLLPRTPKASPSLPFFVSTQGAAKGKNARAIAVVKFRHAPYDTLAVVAEKLEGRWRVVSIGSAVDH